MTEKQISWLSAKSTKTPDTVSCPVCSNPRNKGNHQKCSKITQLKHALEKAVIPPKKM